jgi:hypothetical protein
MSVALLPEPFVVDKEAVAKAAEAARRAVARIPARPVRRLPEAPSSPVEPETLEESRVPRT